VTVPSRLAVGDVMGAHGVRGLLRVRPYNAASPNLAVQRVVYVGNEGSAQAHRILSVAAHRNGLLVALDGVSDRASAEALVGQPLTIDRSELAALDEDEFYHHEMLGLAVETEDGRLLGTIAGTMETGLNDVWIVRDGKREHLVPVIADVVVTVDRAAGRVLIRALPGLLD